MIETPRPALPQEASGPDARWFHELEPRRFLVKLGILATLVVVSGAGALSTHGPIRFGFQVAMAIGFAHATELLHQCLHRTATGNVAWDRALGVALGLPTLVAYWSYLYTHFLHHRDNGKANDGESFGYAYGLIQSRDRATRLLGLALHLSMAAHFRMAAGRMALAVSGGLEARLQETMPALPPAMAARIAANYRLISAVTAAAVAVGCATRPALMLHLWLVPLAIWAVIHALIELPEHFLCDHPDEHTGRNTRSIGGGRFASWLTNWNHAHVGHHDDPRIPPEKLAEYERRLRRTGGFKHVEISYLAFYRKFFRYLIDGKPF